MPLLAFAVLWQGFLFLRSNDAPKVVSGVVAVVWGVGGVAADLLGHELGHRRFPTQVGSRDPAVPVIGPAIALLIWFLALPTLRTLWISLFNADSSTFVGLGNYLASSRTQRS